MSDRYSPNGPARQAENAAWRQGIERLQTEAGGALNIDIINAAAGAHLAARSMAGDYEAGVLLRAVAHAIAQIGRAPRSRPSLCVFCPRRIRRISPATVFGIASPAIVCPSNVLAFAFCDRCGSDPATLPEKARQGLQRIWPDLRPVTVTHGAPEVMQ
jgi:hypothetical protein